ncbi:glycosyltransferase [Streptococcus saliviloxodontae]|uniref:Glycosyltransferase involved in cell wall biosynthesis n=1 Tax=Streptococcus saliviloxodontae TaxID=1349416 RepID=A0ABS2PL32_9STRE|nr:glycosyltransferase [Streptococcus saliviloxodontae]MBM7635982.1 glycosyltransferase involved in cell wall biosynthesis [Streptococcus saliviloxodontae]
MKILHYTIGFLPERTGGLVNYAFDLINEQIKQGHQVSALYPANQVLFSEKVRIKETNKKSDFKCFELYNSLPMPLFGGISEPERFMTEANIETYKAFLIANEFDSIHVHSLIGLHKEFFEAAKMLGVSIVYTTHDYFGLAPIPSFYYNKHSFDDENTNLAWNIMSADALSVSKLRIFQHSYYPLVRKILKMLNRNPKHVAYRDIDDISESTNYSSLRNYYKDIFSKIDAFHFNSELTKEVFTKNLPFTIKGDVISITNATIKKHDIEKKQATKKTIAYIGPDEEYKGYFDFLEFSKSVNLEQYDVQTYGHYPNEWAYDFIQQKGRFQSSERDSVYQSIDILIVPSRWKETFGLIVLEALSYGVTVLVSDSVGAKDLVASENRFKELNSVDLSKVNSQKVQTIKTMKQHAEEMTGWYSKVQNEKN